MTDEIWKDVVGYEGLYAISNTGKLKSYDHLAANGHFHRGMIITPVSTPDGYLRVGIYKNGKRKNVVIHRLVAEAFLPNPNNYTQINHIDEDKTNNCVTNLEWCTPYYNLHYGSRRYAISGEKCWLAKLTAQDVASIKSEYKKNVPGCGVPAIAKKYGVSRRAVFNIIHGISWRHLLKEETA